MDKKALERQTYVQSKIKKLERYEQQIGYQMGKCATVGMEEYLKRDLKKTQKRLLALRNER